MRSTTVRARESATSTSLPRARSANDPHALIIAALCLIAPATGCEEEKPPPTYRVTFNARSDDEPLGGVRIIADGIALGETGADGTLGVTLQGREGQSVAVNAQCPPGHRAVEQPPLLMLRCFRGVDPAAARRGIEMTVQCPPSERIAVLVIRAAGQAGLPVMMRGREVAQTDESGVAHLRFSMRPNTSFRVDLDTSEHENLRPQNPGATFTLSDADQIFLYDQPFRVRVRRRHHGRRPHAAAPPPLPVRID